MDIEQIARVCHEANRAYCESIGDDSQKFWSEVDRWQRISAIDGVLFALSNPNKPPSLQHEAWLRDKEIAGWKYGPIKDTVKKEHPCMVPYDELPEQQRFKDHLFQSVVKAFYIWSDPESFLHSNSELYIFPQAAG